MRSYENTGLEMQCYRERRQSEKMHLVGLQAKCATGSVTAGPAGGGKKEQAEQGICSDLCHMTATVGVCYCAGMKP